jgi:hypothetical protein
MRTSIVYEMIAIGILTILFLWPSYFLVSGKFPEKELVKMALGAFVLGSSMHLFLEVVGANEKWCRITYK